MEKDAFDLVHEFKPRFIEAGLFAHPELIEEVTRINKQIQSLAPVLSVISASNP